MHIILYFFIASLLLYWRMNPWTRACSSVSLLFKVTFDHPPQIILVPSGLGVVEHALVVWSSTTHLLSLNRFLAA